MARTTIYLPDDLARMVAELPASESVSGIAAEALAARVRQLRSSSCTHEHLVCDRCGCRVKAPARKGVRTSAG